MKLKNWLKQLNYRHFICIGLTLGFIALSVFYYRLACIYTFYSIVDIVISFGIYFCTLLKIPNSIIASVLTPPDVTIDTFIPLTFDDFVVKMRKYGYALINFDSLKAYSIVLSKILYSIIIVFLIVLPMFLLINFCVKKIIIQPNNNYGHVSKPMRIYKTIYKKLYLPIKIWFFDFVQFIKNSSYWWKIWLGIWLINLNVVTVICEFLAYIVYFSVTLDLLNIYAFVFKEAVNLSIVFSSTHWIIWLIVAWIVILILRRRKGYKRLNRQESHNSELLSKRPIVFMLCGSMGTKKTTLLTSLALTQDVYFRNKALELLQKNDRKFPHFPWLYFEIDLRNAMSCHNVINLATAKKWVRDKKQKWIAYCKDKRKIWYYDFATFGYYYDDNLKIVDIWQVLENYAQLYFIYVIQSSLIVSNLGLREDNVLISKGNFPIWNSEFFETTASNSASRSTYAHILDYDTLRLGKKVIENNKKNGSFEFGCICMTEIGKERGNQVELRGVKKKDDDTNQLNDNFNGYLKMCRHSATVDNFPFIRFICDEQRADSWGADARELCDIVTIDDCSEQLLTLPFFFIEDLFLPGIIARLNSFYIHSRVERADTTLTLHLLHLLLSKLNNYYDKIYNTFGFYKLDTFTQSGTRDQKANKESYFISCKKVYSDKFCTDCYSDYFNVLAERSKLGLADYETYNKTRASYDELKKQNSYFINSLDVTFRRRNKTERKRN